MPSVSNHCDIDAVSPRLMWRSQHRKSLLGAVKKGPAHKAIIIDLGNVLELHRLAMSVKLFHIRHFTKHIWHSSSFHLKLFHVRFLPLSPPGWRGIVVTVRAAGRVGGRAGGCQTCGTHISVTAWWIFTVRSSVELSRPVVVHCHGHLPICPIWACPWAKNLSNLAQIGSRLCGTHISQKHWMDLPHLKFHGFVWTCSCATS